MTTIKIGVLDINIDIEQVGLLYVIKTRYEKKLFLAVEESIEEAKQTIANSIAIYRSLTAWGK